MDATQLTAITDAIGLSQTQALTVLGAIAALAAVLVGFNVVLRKMQGIKRAG